MAGEILQGLLEQCPGEIKSSMKDLAFTTGELMLRQGDEPRYVYFLLSGRAKAYFLTPNGLSYLTYIYGGDELFGEIEILGGKPIVCNVKAFTDCRVLRIDREHFLRWLTCDSEFSLYIYGQLADKIYGTCYNIATNVAYPLRYRVEYYLWNAATAGKKYVEKDDLFGGLGARVRSVNRILRDLITEGLIESDRGILRVRSLEKLVQDMRRRQPDGEDAE